MWQSTKSDHYVREAVWPTGLYPLTETFLGLSRVPPHECLLNRQATSFHWRLAFVLKE